MEIETCERIGDWWMDEKGDQRSKWHAQIKNEPRDIGRAERIHQKQ